MHYAAANGAESACSALLNNGADINAQDSYNTTPLLIAVKNGYVSIVDLLLTYGADMNRKGSRGFTCLHYACEEGNLEMVKYLIEKGASITRTNSRHQSCLFSALKHADIVHYLIEQIPDKKTLAKLLLTRDETTRTVGHHCAEHGYKESLKALIEAIEASKNSASVKQFINDKELTHGNTLLHFAVANNQMEMVQLLVLHAVDPNFENWVGKTPLQVAVERNMIEMASYLISKGNAKWDPSKDQTSLFNWKLDKALANELIKQQYTKYLKQRLSFNSSGIEGQNLEDEYFPRFVCTREFQSAVDRMTLPELMQCVTAIKLVSKTRPISHKNVMLPNSHHITSVDVDFALNLEA